MRQAKRDRRPRPDSRAGLPTAPTRVTNGAVEGAPTGRLEGSANAHAWLLMLETGGNQEYIFATNRVRENVGASHITAQATTGWLDEALEALAHRASLPRSPDGRRLGEVIDGKPVPFEVVQRISGSALVLFSGDRLGEARRVAAEVTARAIAEAPGLDLASGIVPAPQPEGASGKQFADAVRAASARVQENRAARPGAGARHPRLPITASCESSPGGACAEQRMPGEEEVWRPAAAASIAKRRAAHDGFQRIARLVEAPQGTRLARSADEIERLFEGDLPWLGCVHADGNGIGAVLLELAAAGDARSYLSGLVEFSTRLEACGLRALEAALREVEPVGGVVPVVPLVFGGDDLTALVPGRQALGFTAAYLRTFEAETAAQISDLAPGGRLSASAGVAITKPHHPFSDAYQLAERLADSAKRVKLVVRDANKPVPCSAVDFHMLYDSIAGELDDLRASLRVGGVKDAALLTARPYVVSEPLGEPLAPLSSEAAEWFDAHDYRLVRERCDALTAPDPDDPTRLAISRSRVLSLRSALGAGVEAADAHAALAVGREPALGSVLEHDGERHTPFTPRPKADTKLEGAEAPALHCRLLDALDIVELERVDGSS